MRGNWNSDLTALGHTGIFFYIPELFLLRRYSVINRTKFRCMPRYTPEQLEKRNASVWTTTQGILAPIQFVVFLAGLVVTLLYKTGIVVDDFSWVTIFVVLKTLIFILIFVTGAFFEKDVFDEYVFAPEFFWEDVGSTIAIIIHISYFVFFSMGMSETILIWTALMAYLSYLINAAQFLIRLIVEKRHANKLHAQSEGN